jgi:hypothetical protein
LSREGLRDARHVPHFSGENDAEVDPFAAGPCTATVAQAAPIPDGVAAMPDAAAGDGALSARASFPYNSESNPPAGRKNSDTTSRVALVYSC